MLAHPALARWANLWRPFGAQSAIHLSCRAFGAFDFRSTGGAKGVSPARQGWVLGLWSYVAGICKQEGIFVHEVGGMPDHLHLLIQVPASLALAKAVATIKANSSRWAHERGHKFTWQPGYAAFSVSTSVVPTVVRYIQNQAGHHKKMSFNDEFLALLKKHGLQADLRDTSIDGAETSEPRDE